MRFQATILIAGVLAASTTVAIGAVTRLPAADAHTMIVDRRAALAATARVRYAEPVTRAAGLRWWRRP